MKRIELSRNENGTLKDVYQPTFFRLGIPGDRSALENLFSNNRVSVHDDIKGQLKELIKSLNPSLKIHPEQYDLLIQEHLGGQDTDEYGVWVYYPWSGKLVHLLDEEEFVEVRTNRNRYKITKGEQALLRQKKVGIIGLSVGQSIALTMAMERICGELRLADFDTAELSNLNRIRTGIHNLGLRKTVIAAREIAEIDPFINIKIFNDGLTTDNIEQFFTGEGKLDLVVEVCDGLDIKIISRFKARSLGIPVVMDTNDRGMMDIERFDLQPDRPILHGLTGDLDPDKIKDLTNEDKIPYILKMVGADTLSQRMKASMMEVEQSINTWPQLASSVVLGGALTTDVCRRIFLDQYHESGRYYIDLDELICDTQKIKYNSDIPAAYQAPPELSWEEIGEIADKASTDPAGAMIPNDDELRMIIEAATLAPSGGNAQPWKYYFRGSELFIFHDRHYSHSLLDYKDLGSYIAFGAAIENIVIKAAAINYSTDIKYFPQSSSPQLIAVINFSKATPAGIPEGLERYIYIRTTNRNLGERQLLADNFYNELRGSITGYDGAKLHIISEDKTMNELGEILATTEMLRLIHPRGHYDTFTNEIRWTAEENELKKDGMDVATLGISQAEILALKVASDKEAIDFLRTVNGGGALKKMTRKAVAAASSLGILTMPDNGPLSFLQGGRALERIWLETVKAGVALQPIAQFVFMTERLKDSEDSDLNPYFRDALADLQVRFNRLLPQLSGEQPVFIFRLSKTGKTVVRSLRRELSKVFKRIHDKTYI